MILTPGCQTLMASELLRYHAIWTRRPCGPNKRSWSGAAAAAVESARSDGLPAMIIDDPALESADERKAIEAPTVSQIPAMEANSADDVIDAELVEPVPAGRGLALMAGRLRNLLTRTNPGRTWSINSRRSARPSSSVRDGSIRRS